MCSRATVMFLFVVVAVQLDITHVTGSRSIVGGQGQLHEFLGEGVKEIGNLVCLQSRDVKFSILIGSDWLQMGHIWDFLDFLRSLYQNQKLMSFFRSFSVHFGSPSQNLLNLI